MAQERVREMQVHGGATIAENRESFVRATVVRAARPTSAHPGDVALIYSSGEIDGFVGGSCVEASVRRYGLQVLATNTPLLLRVVPGEPSGATEEGAVEVSNPCLSGGAVEIFLEPHRPPPRMIVVGLTPVAQALSRLGAELGMAVQLTEGSAEPRPDDAAFIVASHGRDEEPALEAALRMGVPYVALVASPRRGRAVVASLDVDELQRSRVHSPAGLDLGARTPGEIALSILAEMISERSIPARDPAALNEPAAASEPPTAIDPVCGMTVAAVESSLHAHVNGRTIYFCSNGCRTAFLADPEKYVSAP
jgi:xanthine dehydrogenase accessory factor